MKYYSLHQILTLCLTLCLTRYKQDQLVRRSAWDRSPKLYSRDAFNVTCDVLSIDGSSVSKPGDHEVIIFDEKGELFAATYFNCPVRNDSKPHQVNFHFIL